MPASCASFQPRPRGHDIDRADHAVYILQLLLFDLGDIVTKTAKLFSNGGSQAVRLPAEFRFEAEQVYVRRDSLTGDVILSSRPRSNWQEFMALRAQLGPLTDELLVDRRQHTEPRDPFKGWQE